MNTRTSPNLIFISLSITLALMMFNPGNAFADTFTGTPVFPTCTPGADPDGAGPLTQTPDAVLITGIIENTPADPDFGLLGGMDPANGINGGGSFSYTFIPDPDGTGPQLPMLQFTEVWTTSVRSYILLCGIDSQPVEYQVKKIMTNNTPLDSWIFFDNELIDPSGSTNDLLQDQAPLPYVTILGAAWSHSNEFDGLSFAMGTQDNLRTSTQFSLVVPNEVGTIDFLNYQIGTMNPGDQDNPMSFALRENFATEIPFIVTQAPNFIRDCELTNTCPIGGEFLGVDTTALLVTGAQMNAAWLIPLVLGTIGIGIVLAKKFRN